MLLKEEAAEWNMGDFDAQNLANTVWSFAMVGQKDELLFAALAKAAA